MMSTTASTTRAIRQAIAPAVRAAAGKVAVPLRRQVHRAAPGRVRSRRRTAAAAALLLATTAGVSVLGSGSAQAAAHPYCGIWWGSLPKTTPAGPRSGLSDAPTERVRAGRHACFDRFVVDGPAFAAVRYVDRITMDGSGAVVPVRGGARLEIITGSGIDGTTGGVLFLPAPSRRAELVDVDGYRTFRQVAWAGDFEGRLTLGLGTRARLPFRAFVLPGPGKGSRVVIDVAHHW